MREGKHGQPAPVAFQTEKIDDVNKTLSSVLGDYSQLNAA